MKKIEHIRLIIDTVEEQLYIIEASLVSDSTTGNRNQQGLTLRPKSQNIIEATCPTVGAILAVPLQHQSGISVGNSISVMQANTVNFILANPTIHLVEITEGTHVASYELMPPIAPEDTTHRVIDVEGFDATLAVGDELDPA